MRISDWSSDVCSSDLLKSCQNVFKLAALGRLERLGLQLFERSHAQFDKQRPRHFIVGKKGAVTCLDIPHGGFRQGGHEPAGNRSEERRVGKECVRTGRSRWSP